MSKNPNNRRKYLLIFFLLLLALCLVVASALHRIYRSDGVVMVDRKKRGYLLHVPASYKPGTPVPLVISLHGFAEWPAHLMGISGWNKVADENNFIVVYPRGSSFPLRWYCNGRRGETRRAAQDVKFISALIDQLGQSYSIDTNRVYANGLSNGGGMSCLLACKLSQRIAAIGSVSGAYLLPASEWNAPRHVPIILFHGTQDPLVPFHGGPSKAFPIAFPDVPKWVEMVGTNYGFNLEPAALPSISNATGVRYSGGSNDAEIVFYTINGGGHTWPGGGRMPRFIVGHTPTNINATRLMWDFFKNHPLNK